MKLLACILVSLWAGCTQQTVDLGQPIDAAIDAAVDSAPNLCRCRITRCRNSGDCRLTGGTCGADFVCTGDFGACTADTLCVAQSTDSSCTKSATSTVKCGL